MDLVEINFRLEQIEKLLKGRKTVLSLREAAEYLGLSVSYLYKLSASGTVPHSKPNGKKVYFSKNDLDAWMVGNRRKGASEAEQDACNYLTFKTKSDVRR